MGSGDSLNPEAAYWKMGIGFCVCIPYMFRLNIWVVDQLDGYNVTSMSANYKSLAAEGKKVQQRPIEVDQPTDSLKLIRL